MAVFNYDGNAYIVPSLSGRDVSLGGVQFNAGWRGISLKIIEPNMTGTKVYYPYIFQRVSSYTYFYDAPKIIVQY